MLGGSTTPQTAENSTQRDQSCPRLTAYPHPFKCYAHSRLMHQCGLDFSKRFSNFRGWNGGTQLLLDLRQ